MIATEIKISCVGHRHNEEPTEPIITTLLLAGDMLQDEHRDDIYHNALMEARRVTECSFVTFSIKDIKTVEVLEVVL